VLCGAVEHEKRSCRDAVAVASLELVLEQVFHAQVPLFFPNPLIRVHAFVFNSVGCYGEMESIASEVLNYGDANLRWFCGCRSHHMVAAMSSLKI
jgi:hypothetical protein